jgi:transposase
MSNSDTRKFEILPRLADPEWEFMKPFVVRPRKSTGRPQADARPLLDGVFWVARGDYPWREMPPVYGKWDTAFRFFRRLSLENAWENALQTIVDFRPSLNGRPQSDWRGITWDLPISRYEKEEAELVACVVLTLRKGGGSVSKLEAQWAEDVLAGEVWKNDETYTFTSIPRKTVARRPVKSL